MSALTPHASMLRLILGAIGATSACGAVLAAPGCGGGGAAAGSTGSGGASTGTAGDTSATSTGSGGASSTTGTGGAGVTSGTGGASSTTGTGGAGVTTGSGGAGGAGPTSSSSSSSSGMPIDCKPHLVSTSLTAPDGACIPPGDPFDINFNCFSPPPPPATCASAYTDACVLATYKCGLIDMGDTLCGPKPGPMPNTCCYVITGSCAAGRPFTVDGVARLAALVPGEGWRRHLAPDVRALDPDTRAALADAWGREALFEHASIASFARFVMQLLALGAPAELVLAAQRALVDEHDHARTCFGLASAYAGRALQPSALPSDGALDDGKGAVGMAAIAASLAREGCVAETVSAMQVQRAADEARDPVVKAALEGIAAQEMEHAALAWRALAWVLARGDEAVRAAVARVFAEAEAHVSLGAVTGLAGDGAAMRAHGYLPVEERRALAREALGRVVGPAAMALMRKGREGGRRAAEAV